MKQYITLLGLLVSCQLSQAANELDINYQHQNLKDIHDADIVKVAAKFPEYRFLNAIYSDLTFKNWDLEDSKLDKNGVSGTVVGYYDIGTSKDFAGVTQAQYATSDLFPKSTLYQEISYRAGDKKNILLGIGIGWQDYYDDDSELFYKVGPVYYFEGGSVSYKYGKYNDSKSKLNSISANYDFNNRWKIAGTYNFGEGHWNYQDTVLLNSVNVKSSEFDVKVSRQINPETSIYISAGKTRIKDKDTDKVSLNSDNFGVGLHYSW